MPSFAETERRREIPKVSGKGNGEGCPSLANYESGGAWGSSESFPSGVLEESRPKTVLMHFELERTHLMQRCAWEWESHGNLIVKVKDDIHVFPYVKKCQIIITNIVLFLYFP